MGDRECLELPEEQTFPSDALMSANDPKQTLLLCLGQRGLLGPAELETSCQTCELVAHLVSLFASEGRTLRHRR